MLNVEFENLLYLSPSVAVHEETAIVYLTSIKDLNYILDMCDKVIDESKDVIEEELFYIYPLKSKG